MKVFCSFNKKQRKFNSYSKDYAVLFYIWLFRFFFFKYVFYSVIE